ncbi:hypothetical protein, partial [Pseudomonas urmiensis]|uniref:hypothetical protein n=1 Tax=Pseudomonas urmiensis TaxID=2745493 RepID=UPI0034D723CF
MDVLIIQIHWVRGGYGCSVHSDPRGSRRLWMKCSFRSTVFAAALDEVFIQIQGVRPGDGLIVQSEPGTATP